jgi:SAM-dependent methyltransferase
MPIEDSVADVVVSNCVMNLVPDKQKAFAETFRILKQGGHFSISDIVLTGILPENIRSAAVMYAGCVSGAQQKDEYLETIKKAGFVNVAIQKEKKIILPDNIVLQYLPQKELDAFRKDGAGIYSITVYAEKP